MHHLRMTSREQVAGELFATYGPGRTRWIEREGSAREAMYLSGMRNLNLIECSTKSGDAD
jgi:hypothetical protein